MFVRESEDDDSEPVDRAHDSDFGNWGKSGAREWHLSEKLKERKGIIRGYSL